MKAVVKKTFATRLKGYYVGEVVEVSESEYKDLACFLAPINETKSETKQDNQKEEKKSKKKAK